MKIVKLIDDNFSSDEQPDWVKNVLLVGDPLPELNQNYIVKTTYYKNSEVIAYELEGFEHLKNYSKGAGFFMAKRFEIVSHTYIPNCVVNIGDSEYIAEKNNMIAEITFDNDEIVDNKIEITTFIKE